MASMSPTVQETASDKTGMMMKEAFEVVKQARPGDSEARLAWNSVSTTEFDDAMNTAINFLYSNSLILDQAAAYFDRDNVGLPGVALYAKASSVDCRNIAWRYIDFNNKRGAAAKIGAVGAPPVEFHAEHHSDVLSFYSKALASVKVSYKLANDAFKIALSNADAHAVNFLSNMAQLYSEKIRTLSHHVTHLTLVESDKHAIKEFDRKLQEDVVSFAMAVGLESTLPNRLVQGAMSRLTDVSNSMLNTATWGLDNGSMCSAHSAFKNNELGS